MEENMQEKLEEIAMMIIANSGQARSDAFAALQEAKKGKFRRRRENSEGGRRESSNSTRISQRTVEDGCVRRSDAGKYFIVSCAGSSDGKCTGTGFDPGNDRFISKVGKSKEESYGTKSIIDLRRWDVYRNSDA